MTDLVYIIIFAINLIGMLVITLVIAALTLIERKFLALNQRRVGPYYVGYRGRLQYIADALKLFIKGVVIYDESNKFWFVAVPSICGLICYFFWVNSVWCPSVSIVDIEYNLVYATLLSISFSFCVILLGYFSGNKYTRLASIRSSLMVLNLELFLGLMILTTVVVTESFCFSVFVEYQKFWWLIFTYSGLLGLLCLLFLLEVGRTPFDLAEAESELVTGYSTEIGGFTFGIFYLGEYFHLFFFSSVMSIIFLGGWEYPSFLGLNYFTDYLLLFGLFDTFVSKITIIFYLILDFLKLCDFLLSCVVDYIVSCISDAELDFWFVKECTEDLLEVYIDYALEYLNSLGYGEHVFELLDKFNNIVLIYNKFMSIGYDVTDFLHIEFLARFCMICDFFHIDGFYIADEFNHFIRIMSKLHWHIEDFARTYYDGTYFKLVYYYRLFNEIEEPFYIDLELPFDL